MDDKNGMFPFTEPAFRYQTQCREGHSTFEHAWAGRKHLAHWDDHTAMDEL